MAISPRYLEFLRSTTQAIQDAQKPVRILRALSWPVEVARDFFARGARELPRPVYGASRDAAAAVTRFTELEARLGGDNEMERFLRATCDSYRTAARMLASVGSEDFYRHSCDLYGRPESAIRDGKTTNLELARHFDQVIGEYAGTDLMGGEPAVYDDAAAAAELSRRLQGFFVGHPIRVEIDDTIAANAVAGADVVRLKRGARFSERDLLQLEYHEGHVHVATTLNGRSQPMFSFLGSGAPRTTNMQEGLAIFTEFICQVMNVERLRRLTDRILAIHMSEQGADFLDLYRFFLEHDHTEAQAFDCARRVVRGGRVEGGAPFTKDVCYLDGLLKVTNFLRVALTRGYSEYVQLLFVGKLDLDDIPLIAHLSQSGLVAAPRYVPRWAQDLNFLTAYMSYSAFLGRIDLQVVRQHYEEIIERAAADWPAGEV
ncbi:MAG TPA: flavohemoglobin expression-modulating QEGLA motif protein [Polyangia bacterium]|nr:flavohemoglobin expression-modulating QEGLA motif protein [Polyangia bacterium]